MKIFLLLILVFAGGCSVQNNSHLANPQAGNAPADTSTGSQAELANIDDAISSIDLQCDGSNCPGNAGMILAITSLDTHKYLIERCSGTLIADSIVLTNAHCIPPEVRKKAALCSQDIGFIVNTDGPNRSKCKTLLYASEIGEDAHAISADFALIQLQGHLNIQAAALSNEGVLEQSYWLYPVFPDPEDPLAAHLRAVQCQASRSMGIVAGYTGPLSSLVSLLGEQCITAHGNSGAAIRNQKGEVVAILNDIITNAHSETGHDVIATNLSCLSLLPGMHKNKDCAQSEILSSDTKTSIEQKDKSLQEALKQLKERLPTNLVFKYRLTEESSASGKTKIGLYLSPICIKPISDWPQREKKVLHKKGKITSFTIEISVGSIEVQNDATNWHWIEPQRTAFLFQINSKTKPALLSGSRRDPIDEIDSGTPLQPLHWCAAEELEDRLQASPDFQ